MEHIDTIEGSRTGRRLMSGRDEICNLDIYKKMLEILSNKEGDCFKLSDFIIEIPSTRAKDVCDTLVQKTLLEQETLDSQVPSRPGMQDKRYIFTDRARELDPFSEESYFAGTPGKNKLKIIFAILNSNNPIRISDLQSLSSVTTGITTVEALVEMGWLREKEGQPNFWAQTQKAKSVTITTS